MRLRVTDLVTVREVVGDDASHLVRSLLTHEEVGTWNPAAPEERTRPIEPLQRMLPVRLITSSEVARERTARTSVEVDRWRALTYCGVPVGNGCNTVLPTSRKRRSAAYVVGDRRPLRPFRKLVRRRARATDVRRTGRQRDPATTAFMSSYADPLLVTPRCRRTRQRGSGTHGERFYRGIGAWRCFHQIDRFRRPGEAFRTVARQSPPIHVPEHGRKDEDPPDLGRAGLDSHERVAGRPADPRNGALLRPGQDGGSLDGTIGQH